jgi:hypothetical protein
MIRAVGNIPRRTTKIPAQSHIEVMAGRLCEAAASNYGRVLRHPPNLDIPA